MKHDISFLNSIEFYVQKFKKFDIQKIQYIAKATVLITLEF